MPRFVRGVAVRDAWGASAAPGYATLVAGIVGSVVTATLPGSVSAASMAGMVAQTVSSASCRRRYPATFRDLQAAARWRWRAIMPVSSIGLTRCPRPPRRCRSAADLQANQLLRLVVSTRVLRVVNRGGGSGDGAWHLRRRRSWCYNTDQGFSLTGHSSGVVGAIAWRVGPVVGALVPSSFQTSTAWQARLRRSVCPAAIRGL